jgi:hypothetical protein
MAAFLVEAYQPRTRLNELAALVRRAAVVAQAMSADGAHVRYVRTTFVPEDEICFHLFESASSEAVEDLCRRAALIFDRVSEAVDPVASEGEMR